MHKYYIHKHNFYFYNVPWSIRSRNENVNDGSITQVQGCLEITTITEFHTYICLYVCTHTIARTHAYIYKHTHRLYIIRVCACL